ncbi:hypothetical protein C7E12_20415, partial [Stenotrophomonas maltophilia]
NALTRYSKQQARLAIVVEQAQAARRAESLAQIRLRASKAEAEGVARSMSRRYCWPWKTPRTR